MQFAGTHLSDGLVGLVWDSRICILLHSSDTDVDVAGPGFTL